MYLSILLVRFVANQVSPHYAPYPHWQSFPPSLYSFLYRLQCTASRRRLTYSSSSESRLKQPSDAPLLRAKKHIYIYIIYTTWFIVYNIYMYNTYIIKYPTYVWFYTLHVNLRVAVHSCRKDSMQRCSQASTPTGASKSGHEAWFTWPKVKGLEVKVVTTSQHLTSYWVIYIYIYIYIRIYTYVLLDH